MPSPAPGTVDPYATPGTALLVAGLQKHYGDVHAVNGLDLSVAGGECFGLLGPNGAGKTTTIEICEGLLAPDAGRVELLGLRWDRNESELRQRLGIQLQETQLADKLTVEETVRLFRSFYSRGRTVDDVIGLVQLEEKRGARVGKLSGGQKQRLALACAIVGDPDLLFLDEPTNGMDPKGRDEMLELVRDLAHNKGVNLILSSHLLPDVEYTCDHVIVMDKGQIAAQGGITALKQPRGRVFELRVKTTPAGPDGLAAFLGVLRAAGLDCHATDEDVMRVFVPGADGAQSLFALAASAGAQVRHLRPSVPTLEDVFAQAVGET
jgi:ABC-2 type transport system ATP-binding protein